MSKKEEKIYDIMAAWQVSAETAELMYIRQKKMTGKHKKKKKSLLTHSLSFGPDETETSYPSPRSNKTTQVSLNKTWIKTSGHQSDTQQARVNNWVRQIDQGILVTPEPQQDPMSAQPVKASSAHFQFARAQIQPLTIRSSTPPLPPLRKKDTVPAWH